MKLYFYILVVLRTLNAILSQTFFQPDEFWQALEPAHYKAFGYGELTWEWTYGLRSYAFSFIFEVLYRIVSGFKAMMIYLAESNMPMMTGGILNSVMKKDYEYIGVIYGPKVVMAVIAAIGEYHILKFVRIIGIQFTKKNSDGIRYNDIDKLTKISFILTSTNFFNCFCITRTFINSFEMTLTAIALTKWDWTQGQEIDSFSFKVGLFVAIFTCLQRPSNALIWIVLGMFLMFNLIRGKKIMSLVTLAKNVIIATLLAFSLNCAIDFYFYGKFVFPVLKFFLFNVTTSLSSFYGVAPWHFHIAQSVPIMLNYCVPFVAHSFFMNLKSNTNVRLTLNPLNVIKWVITINLAIYSALSHKEFRFIYPLQPLFIVLAAFSAQQMTNYKSLNTKFVKFISFFVPAISLVLAFTVARYHESGVISVMKYFHHKKNVDGIGFLMPCHSTPWQSYLHRSDIKNLWALSCEPPLHLLHDPNASAKLKDYMDESDIFYDNVSKFIKVHFPSLFHESIRHKSKYDNDWPEYIVMFEQLEKSYFRQKFNNSSYIEEVRFFNTLSHWDSRRMGDVVVYHKQYHNEY